MSQTQVSEIVETFIWRGASGVNYTFWCHALPFTCDPDQPGNYIFTKIGPDNHWIPVYIGQGDLNIRCNDPLHYRCAVNKGATHIHCHTQPNELARLSEEQDLLRQFPQAYGPIGCNQKIGG
jgi:hypothetical protein